MSFEPPAGLRLRHRKGGIRDDVNPAICRAGSRRTERSSAWRSVARADTVEQRAENASRRNGDVVIWRKDDKNSQCRFRRACALVAVLLPSGDGSAPVARFAKALTERSRTRAAPSQRPAAPLAAASRMSRPAAAANGRRENPLRSGFSLVTSLAALAAAQGHRRLVEADSDTGGARA